MFFDMCPAAASNGWKVDPTFQLVVGMVTGLVEPYTYSDMTGQG
jgi:hypothetical protein